MSVFTPTLQPLTITWFRQLINRRPLVAYFVIAYIGAWIAILPLLLAKNGLALLPFSLPSYPFTTLGSFTGPMLSALLVTAATSGKDGVWQLLRRIIRWRVGMQWYLIALFGFPVLFLSAACLSLGTTPLQTLVQQWPLIFTVFLLPLLTIELFAALGEETGWRGFALPRLQQKYGALRGSIILGTLWALWHFPGYFAWLGPFNLAAFVVNSLLIVILTIIFTWLVNKARGSVLIAMLFHAASNASTPFIAKLVPVFPPLSTLIVLGLIIICTLLIVIFTKGRLSYKASPEAQLAEISLSQSRR